MSFFCSSGDEVDQQVAAAQDVELGEGRVHDEVLRGEDHHLADLFADPVAALLLDEEARSRSGETSAAMLAG